MANWIKSWKDFLLAGLAVLVVASVGALVLVAAPAIVNAASPQPKVSTSPAKKAPASKPRIYVIYSVKMGNNLTKLAAKYDTTVSQLVRWNNIADPDLILEGQRLRVA